MKKFLSLIMSAAIIITSCVFTASGAAAETVTGEAGNSASYSYDSDTNTVTFTGSGKIEQSISSEWEFAESVKTVSVGDGISSIGEYAFTECTALDTLIVYGSETLIKNDDYGIGVLPQGKSITVYAMSGSYAETYAENRADDGVTLKYIYSIYFTTYGNDFDSDSGKRLKDNITIVKALEGTTAEELAEMAPPLTTVSLSAFSDNIQVPRHYTPKGCRNKELAAVTESTTYEEQFETELCTGAEVLKAPTCQENGKTKYTCTKCGKITEQNLPTKSDEYHNYETISETEATCKADGLKIERCTICGNEKETVLPKEGHSYGNYTSDGNATCTQDGTKTAYCLRCGAKDTVADTGSALGHSYKLTVTAPTCTEQGYTTYTCIRCSYGYVSDYTPATGHNFTGNAQYCLNGCGTANPNYVDPAATTTSYVQTNVVTVPAATTKSTVSKPKKTSIKKLKKGKKKITVQWKKVSGVKGYQVQVATNKKFTKNKKTVTIKKQKTTKTTVKKLKSKKKYYVRVRTYKVVNGKKIYSSWSKVKTIKTK